MTEIGPSLESIVRTSLADMDILWQINGHKLNVRLFEEITRGHAKAKEDPRLQIGFVSRASLVFPLACVANRRTWSPKWRVLCAASRQKRTGRRLCSSDRLQTRSLTGWTPVRCPSGSPSPLAAFASAPVLTGNGVCSDRDGKLSREEVVKVLGAKDGAVLWNLAGKLT